MPFNYPDDEFISPTDRSFASSGQRTNRTMQTRQNIFGNMFGSPRSRNDLDHYRSLSHRLQQELVRQHNKFDNLEAELAVADSVREDTERKLDEANTQLGRLSKALREKQASEAQTAELQKQVAQWRQRARDHEQDMHSFEQEMLNWRGFAGDKEAEIHDLKQSMAELKRTIAVLSQKANPVPDDMLATQFMNILHQTESWVVSNFSPPQTLPANDILTGTTIQFLTPFVDILRTLQPSEVFALCRSWVAANLLAILKSFYFGIEEDVDFGLFIELWENETIDAQEKNEWRSKTAKLLNEQQSEAVKAETAKRAQGIVDVIDSVLCEVMLVDDNPHRRDELAEIVQMTIDFHHRCQEQVASFGFDMSFPAPHKTYFVDGRTMEDVEGRDIALVADRSFKFSVSPSMWKEEYDQGKQPLTCIVKMKVCCDMS